MSQRSTEFTDKNVPRSGSFGGVEGSRHLHIVAPETDTLTDCAGGNTPETFGDNGEIEQSLKVQLPESFDFKEYIEILKEYLPPGNQEDEFKDAKNRLEEQTFHNMKRQIEHFREAIKKIGNILNTKDDTEEKSREDFVNFEAAQREFIPRHMGEVVLRMSKGEFDGDPVEYLIPKRANIVEIMNSLADDIKTTADLSKAFEEAWTTITSMRPSVDQILTMFRVIGEIKQIHLADATDHIFESQPEPAANAGPHLPEAINDVLKKRSDVVQFAKNLKTRNVKVKR